MKKLLMVTMIIPVLLVSCTSLSQLNASYEDELYDGSVAPASSLPQEQPVVSAPAKDTQTREPAQSSATTVDTTIVNNYNESYESQYLPYAPYDLEVLPDYYYTRRLYGWGGYGYPVYADPYFYDNHYYRAYYRYGYGAIAPAGWYYYQHTPTVIYSTYDMYHNDMMYSVVRPSRKMMPRESSENKSYVVQPTGGGNNNRASDEKKGNFPARKVAQTILKAPSMVFRREHSTRGSNRSSNETSGGGSVTTGRSGNPAVVDKPVQERSVFRPFSNSSDDYRRRSPNSGASFQPRDPAENNSYAPSRVPSGYGYEQLDDQRNRPNYSGGQRSPRR